MHRPFLIRDSEQVDIQVRSEHGSFSGMSDHQRLYMLQPTGSPAGRALQWQGIAAVDSSACMYTRYSRVQKLILSPFVRGLPLSVALKLAESFPQGLQHILVV